MALKLQKIDELYLSDHEHIVYGDECFFIKEYKPHEGYTYSDTNSLILNLKKGPSEPYQNYKDWAVTKVAQFLENIFSETELSETLFIPMPTSKLKDDPGYDNRLIRILKAFTDRSNTGAKYVDALQTVVSRNPLHAGGIRNVEWLYSTIEFNNDLIPRPLPKVIVLFDDVIRKGTTFKACQRRILEVYPNTTVYGLFIARCV